MCYEIDLLLEGEEVSWFDVDEFGRVGLLRRCGRAMRPAHEAKGQIPRLRRRSAYDGSSGQAHREPLIPGSG